MTTRCKSLFLHLQPRSSDDILFRIEVSIPFFLSPTHSLSFDQTICFRVRYIFATMANHHLAQVVAIVEQKNKIKIRKIYTPPLSINGHPRPDVSFGPSHSIRRLYYTQGRAKPIPAKCVTYEKHDVFLPVIVDVVKYNA